MVGHVPSRALSHDETLAEVSKAQTVKNTIVDEFQAVKSVAELGRELVLWREVVVDGDDDGEELAGEVAA